MTAAITSTIHSNYKVKDGRTRCPPAPAVARAGRIVRRHQLSRARKHRKGSGGNEEGGGKVGRGSAAGTGEGIEFLGGAILRVKG